MFAPQLVSVSTDAADFAQPLHDMLATLPDPLMFLTFLSQGCKQKPPAL
jgi:hypothetical protein